MAKKSSTASSGTKKASPKAAVKKTAVKKAPKASAGTASKTGTPKATKKSAAKKSTAKKSAPKKASAPKLNDRQVEFLKKIHGTGEAGYAAGKGEDKTIAALSTRKLVKRGKKNPATGKHHYMLTKVGQKQIPSASAPAPAGA
jgi:hypothetical protein